MWHLRLAIITETLAIVTRPSETVGKYRVLYSWFIDQSIKINVSMSAAIYCRSRIAYSL
jgi:hypothetical protein